VAGGAIGIAGSLLSQAAQEKDKKKQKELIDRAAAEFDKIDLPDEEKARVFYGQLQRVAPEYVPEEYKAQTQANSEMAKISTDPALKQAQLKALAGLQDVAKGGMTLQDKLDMEDQRRNMLGQSKQAQQNIMANLQARGASSPGMELVARQQAAQAASDQMARYNAGVQAQAQQRALQALLQSGQLGGQMRDQDFGEQAQKARAQDIINQFNTQTLNQAGMYNVGNRNQAQQLNNAEKQRINDANWAAQNRAVDHNAGLGQQQFDNRMKLAAGKSGQLGNQAAWYGQQAKETGDRWGGMMQGATQLGGEYMKYRQGQNAADDYERELQMKYENRYIPRPNKG
jgi:hypothetical protein